MGKGPDNDGPGVGAGCPLVTTSSVSSPGQAALFYPPLAVLDTSLCILRICLLIRWGCRGNGRAGGQRNGSLPARLVNFGTPPLGSLDHVVCPLLGMQTHWQRPRQSQGGAATLADEEVTCWDVSLGYFITWPASASQTHPAAVSVRPGSPSILCVQSESGANPRGDLSPR